MSPLTPRQDKWGPVPSPQGPANCVRSYFTSFPRDRSETRIYLKLGLLLSFYFPTKPCFLPYPLLHALASAELDPRHPSGMSALRGSTVCLLYSLLYSQHPGWHWKRLTGSEWLFWTWRPSLFYVEQHPRWSEHSLCIGWRQWRQWRQLNNKQNIHLPPCKHLKIQLETVH